MEVLGGADDRIKQFTTEPAERPRVALSIYNGLVEAADYNSPHPLVYEVYVNAVAALSDFCRTTVVFNTKTDFFTVKIFREETQGTKGTWDSFRKKFPNARFNEGFIEITSQSLKDSSKKREWKLIPQTEGYIGELAYLQGTAFEMVREEFSQDEEILDLLGRAIILEATPQQIAKQFGAFDTFMTSLRAPLGHAPIPGVVTDARVGDVALFGSGDEQNELPTWVDKFDELSAIKARKRKEYERKKRVDEAQVVDADKYL